MLKRQPFELNIVDEGPVVWLAVEANQFLEHRRHHLRLGHVFAGQRPVVEFSALTVEIPLAGRIQRIPRILDVVALLRVPSQQPKNGRAGQPNYAILLVHRGNALPGRVPGVEDDDLHVAQILPGMNVAGLEAETIDRLLPGFRLLGVLFRFDQAGDVQIALVGRSRGRPGVR